MFSCQLSLLVIKLSVVSVSNKVGDDCCSGILSSCNVLLSVVSVSNKVDDDCCSGILSSCNVLLSVVSVSNKVVRRLLFRYTK